MVRGGKTQGRGEKRTLPFRRSISCSNGSGFIFILSVASLEDEVMVENQFLVKAKLHRGLQKLPNVIK